jgi:NADH-quinone oxidoreductase subunit M
MQKAFFGAGEAQHHGHPLEPITWPEKIGAVLLIGTSLVVGLWPQVILGRVITALSSPMFDGLRKGGW